MTNPPPPYDRALTQKMLVEASRISDFAADPSRWPAKDLVDRLAAQLASCDAELARVEGERDALRKVLERARDRLNPTRDGFTLREIEAALAKGAK